MRVLLLMGFTLVGCSGAVSAWAVDQRTGNVLERTCVLKLGSKVSAGLLRHSQEIFDENIGR